VRLLVAGAGGMLGLDVLRAGTAAGHELVGLMRAQLDVTDTTAVEGAFARVHPQAVLNCAAWTDVDGAESHREQAHAVNADGARNLAMAAAWERVPLLHVSTDYVFSGEAFADASGAPRAYVESDPTGPRTAYGQTKLEGEREVLAASPRHTVVRSAWLFGVGGRNFAETMLALAAQRRAEPSGATSGSGHSVQVVTDQVGCPTWTGHLAPALIGLLERGVSGLVHLVGAGHASWNGFAREIFRQAEVDCRVEDASTEQMARPAPRPAWSVLESERDDVIPLPPWQDGLAGYLAARTGIARA
jgi:dTDP-4-dehydrorhamnose reductase